MLEEILEERRKKLEKYKETADPYPAEARRDMSLSELSEQFNELVEKGGSLDIVGRVSAWRDQGKIIFLDIKDERGKFQIVLSETECADFVRAQETTDIGDFVEASGIVFKTKRGEQSLQAKNFRIISKNLRPLPSEWYGIEDIELKLRKRYLDLALNPEVREMFIKKDIFWNTIREFLKKEKFHEVETSVLEAVPGGAEAEPFVTHHNALDQDFFLRISLELPLKRLLVGGFEKVFEIGRIFRNEGIDREHLQDYTQMECYWAYANYEDMMRLTREMYQLVIKNMFDSLVTHRGDMDINWGGEWPKVDYYEAFNREAGIDLTSATVDDLKKKAIELGVRLEPNLGRGRLIDLVYKKTVRPTLLQPCFLVNPPADIEPLAKRLVNDHHRVARFQIIAGGTELGKGFSELNDPIDQRERFEDQMKLREAGDQEAQMIDEDFVEALEYGMPPAAGFGMSERLFAVLMDKPVRETVIFPLMRREEK
ncbi:MAG: lysine--tRNA ligase [Candidatus Jorgensenbacteria bacterium]|nr:lysine--tRNA ligase [Candidatus Jorgensenbacteria bacterium]